MEENSSLSDSDDFNQYIEGLISGKKPSERTIAKICHKAKEILSEEPNVVYVEAPTTVCGSLFGQFEDLLEIFRVIGKPPDRNFIFLGHYYFRGSNGVETLSLLFALKARYKNRVVLLRGRAENSHMAERYGLYSECQRKYTNKNVWKLFTDVFDAIPLCAVIDSRLFCTPGGLTPQLMNIAQIQRMNRHEYSQDYDSPTATLVWSQPGENEDWAPSPKGCGYLFPKKISKIFLHLNNLKMIYRLCPFTQEGYSYTHDRMILGLSSAPTFFFRSKGALAEVDEYGEANILQFESAKRDEYVFKGVNYFERKNLVRQLKELI